MKNFLSPIIFSTIIILAFFISSIVYAAPLPTNTNLFIQSTPKVPAPNEEINLRLISYELNLETSSIIWRVDGKEVAGGIGQTTFSFTNGEAGTSQTITVGVTTQGGNTLERTITYTPSIIDLIWEADTYTPPLYQGKALATSESSVNVTAIPTVYDSAGKILTPNDLIFRWERNHTSISSSSGVGKNSIRFLSNKLTASTIITVRIYTLNNTIVGEKTITIPAESPKIIFYEDRPLAGTAYGRILSSLVTMTDNDFTVRAEPYYFSRPQVISGALQFLWAINRNRVTDTTAGRTLNLKRNPGQEGRAEISLDIANPVSVFQTGHKSFVLQYN